MTLSPPYGMAIPAWSSVSRALMAPSLATRRPCHNPRLAGVGSTLIAMARILLFVGVPLLELGLLVWSTGRIGLGWTLAVILLTGFFGATMVKRQGLDVWHSARRRFAIGSFPSDEIAHGAMLLVAGGLLIAPGYLSDVTGCLLLLPVVREWLRPRLAAWFGRRFDHRTTRVEVWRA